MGLFAQNGRSLSPISNCFYVQSPSWGSGSAAGQWERGRGAVSWTTSVALSGALGMAEVGALVLGDVSSVRAELSKGRPSNCASHVHQTINGTKMRPTQHTTRGFKSTDEKGLHVCVYELSWVSGFAWTFLSQTDHNLFIYFSCRNQ